VFPPAGSNFNSFKNSRKNSPKNLKQLFISRDKLCGMISDVNQSKYILKKGNKLQKMTRDDKMK